MCVIVQNADGEIEYEDLPPYDPALAFAKAHEGVKPVRVPAPGSRGDVPASVPRPKAP